MMRVVNALFGTIQTAAQTKTAAEDTDQGILFQDACRQRAFRNKRDRDTERAPPNKRDEDADEDNSLSQSRG